MVSGELGTTPLSVLSRRNMVIPIKGVLSKRRYCDISFIEITTLRYNLDVAVTSLPESRHMCVCDELGGKFDYLFKCPHFNKARRKYRKKW